MKKTFFLKNLPLLLLASALLITVAFAQTTGSHQKTIGTDTVPTKQKKIRDLDEAIDEIDRGEAEMQRAMSDTDKWEADFRKAMDAMKIDMGKMKEDMARSMKELDKQKLQADVQKALQEVDFEKMKKEVQESLAQIDTEKMKAELEKVKAIDFEKMKTELEKVKEIDFKKMREDMEKVRPQMEKAMKEARVGIEKARAEVTAYRNLVNALDRDGLLKKNGSYTVEYKSGELTVNGKKLPAEATKKYSEYLSGKKDFTLKKDEDGLDINND